MTSPIENMVTAHDIRKRYRMGSSELEVLKGVSVEVGRGEAIAITGPSGAGKSTLLHILGGLDQPTEGRVTFQGRDLFAMSAADRTELRATAIGFVFQSYHLLPELDVLENVELPDMARPGFLKRRENTQRRALALLESVGLSARARHTPLELSGGEQQRAALARSLINEPDLVLADEPTGNLDTATGLQVLNYLFALTRERGHTLVLVTHNPEVAARCDRTIHLVDGRVQ
jgi:predicted ABC-type transport system involved in lysophospholipase L1 biosynthesis ATPase subunit